MTRRIGVGGLRRATVVVVTTALLLGAALSGATVGVVDADSPSVAVTDESGGSAVETVPNETVTVTVGANASNVSAYQANLTFDPDVVRVESVSGTDDFDDPVANVDNEGGWVAFNQYRSSNVSDPQLATVTVELVGEAGDETSLAFVESDTKLSDDAAQEQGVEEYNDLTITVESESDGSDDGSGDDGDSDGGETGDDDTDSGDDTDDGDDGDGTEDTDSGDTEDNDTENTDDIDSGDDTEETDDIDSGDDTEETDDADSGDDTDSDNDSDDTDTDDGGATNSDGDDDDGSSDDDDDDGGGASGGSSGGDSAGGDSSAEENDDPPEGPPRVASETASLDDNESIEMTFDGGSPTIERLRLLLDSAVSGEYAATEYERLPTDLADARSDDADSVVTVLEFDTPNESEDAPTQIVLTLNRSAVNASEGNAENLQVERYDEATGQWETLDPAVDNASDGTVTLSVAPSRLGWFVVSTGNASQTDGAAEPANGTDASGNDTANGTGSDSAGTGDTPANDSDSGDATNDSDTTGSSSTEEPGSTESEIPGFGVTTVLAAGAALYGIVRFRRRT